VGVHSTPCWKEDSKNLEEINVTRLGTHSQREGTREAGRDAEIDRQAENYRKIRVSGRKNYSFVSDKENFSSKNIVCSLRSSKREEKEEEKNGSSMRFGGLESVSASKRLRKGSQLHAELMRPEEGCSHPDSQREKGKYARRDHNLS